MWWSPKNTAEAVTAAAAITIGYALIMLPNLTRAPLSYYTLPFWNSFRAKCIALRASLASPVRDEVRGDLNSKVSAISMPEQGGARREAGDNAQAEAERSLLP